jgi:uncharacterized protein YciI
MEKLILIFIAFITTLAVNGQNNTIDYDSTLAKKLGADEYGMKMYVLVILKTGDSTIEDEKVRSELFAGHLKNIGRLVEEGQLIIAGPFGKNNNDFRGLYLFDSSDLEEVKKLLQTDPAISARLLKTELYPWYGSAALPMYLDFHEKIEKIPH